MAILLFSHTFFSPYIKKQLPIVTINLLTMDIHTIPLCLWFFSQFISILAQSDTTYIIHMDLSSMPKAFCTHQDWYLNTLTSIATENFRPSFLASSKLVYTYTTAIHGFSAILSPSELKAIQNLPGFVSSIEDKQVKVDTTHTSKFLGLNTNSGIWPKSNFGKDVIIGLVDTGIWPESMSFNDDGMTLVPSLWKGECESGTQFNSSMCNKKLIGARYFNKGLLAKFPNLTISMNSARDTDGHGTHTSSTAAGNYVEGASYFGYAAGTSSGMAPRARVAMYKALWDEGVFLSDIIAAIDQAIIDGVDVISLSLGVDVTALYEDPVAIATYAAMEKGIFVSTSAGNEGPFWGTLHNGTPWVLTVAAGTVDREFIGKITLGNGISVSGMSLYPGNYSSATKYSLAIISCDDEKEVKKVVVDNKIIVCQDKNQTLSDQVYNIQNSKATGGLFITNNTDIEFFLQSSFPAIFFNPQDGQKILDYVKTTDNPKASFEFQETRFGLKPAPRVASYSSRGPSQSCKFVLKPDIMAPGALILASWAQKSPVTDVNSGQLFSNFNIISGTSMSCPHATGVAALLKSVHPEWSPAAIRSAMMTTSDILDNSLKPIGEIGQSGNIIASPLSMGAGHINPNKALDPGLVYDMELQDYTNLLCAMNFTSKQIQTITRSSTYDNCTKPSLDINYPSFIIFFEWNSNNNASTTTFYRTLTNVETTSSTYVAKITPMDGFKISVTPDTLSFRQKYERQSYKLTIEKEAVKDVVVFGYLSWVENGGKHVVRSPIVATSIRMD